MNPDPIAWRGLEIPAESPFAWRLSTPAIEIVVEKWTNPTHAAKPFWAMLNVELLNPIEARGVTPDEALDVAHARLLADLEQLNGSVREAFGS